MKKLVLEFVKRGLMASSLGPIVLALLYLILKHNSHIDTLSVDSVVLGIISLSALAFIAGGMNVIYQIERLPLMAAILIHGIVLYIAYLSTYLINDWLEMGITPIVVFSVIFIISYIIIWIIIYTLTKKNTDKINEILKEKQAQ